MNLIKMVISYYEDDPELPLYSTVNSGYQASELANILMAKNMNLQRVCHIQPLGVTKTPTFIVDLDNVYSVTSRQMTWVLGMLTELSPLIFPSLVMVGYVLLLESQVVA